MRMLKVLVIKEGHHFRSRDFSTLGADRGQEATFSIQVYGLLELHVLVWFHEGVSCRARRMGDRTAVRPEAPSGCARAK